MFTLALHAYCGMTVPIAYIPDHTGIRQVAARLIRRRRREGYPVAILEIGRRWEIMEPEDCMMVPDDCGCLVLRDPGIEVPL